MLLVYAYSIAPILVVIALCLVVISVVIFLLARYLQRVKDKPVFAAFGVDQSAYRLHSADIGGRKAKPIMTKLVIGCPDALFIKRSNRSGIVCEHKSRRHRGMIRLDERYQVTLYMGVAIETFKLNNVYGVIRYGDQNVLRSHCCVLHRLRSNWVGEGICISLH